MCRGTDKLKKKNNGQEVEGSFHIRKIWGLLYKSKNIFEKARNFESVLPFNLSLFPEGMPSA